MFVHINTSLSFTYYKYLYGSKSWFAHYLFFKNVLQTNFISIAIQDIYLRQERGHTQTKWTELGSSLIVHISLYPLSSKYVHKAGEGSKIFKHGLRSLWQGGGGRKQKILWGARLNRKKICSQIWNCYYVYKSKKDGGPVPPSSVHPGLWIPLVRMYMQAVLRNSACSQICKYSTG